MKPHKTVPAITYSIAALIFLLLAPAPALAHCDGMDGPVVKAAQKALETGNVALVLMWVEEKNEAEIREAFAKTLAVRKLSAEAKNLADMYFFETLVRLHRVGEGASYTGLKPAGRDLGPAIPAADQAIEAGTVEPVLTLLTATIQNGVRESFEQVAHAKKSMTAGDITAGREYVRAYVTFIHYVERLYEAAKNPAHTGISPRPRGRGEVAPDGSTSSPFASSTCCQARWQA